MDRVRDLPEGSQVRDPRRRAVHRADAPVGVSRPHRPGACRLDHRRRAARATARAAAGIAVPADKGKRSGLLVHPREISFTAARRAVVTSTRSGAATASLPAALTLASRDAILAGLARRRVDTDRNRHRDRKTKARPGFPPGGPHLPTRTAAAQISVCGPVAA